MPRRRELFWHGFEGASGARVHAARGDLDFRRIAILL
jgi:hypothetical protein